MCTVKIKRFMICLFEYMTANGSMIDSGSVTSKVTGSLCTIVITNIIRL